MSRTKDAHLVITLTLDFRPFVRAIRQVGRALDRMAEAFTPAGKLRRDRRNHGGMGTDARLYPDLWQTTACTAWLHTSCPTDSRNNLECTCSCHGRAMR